MTPGSIWSISRHFYRGYELCHASDDPQAIVPSVVCLAFAVELSLKAVLATTDKKTWGHKLKVLFELLPEADQYEVNRLTGYDAERFDAALLAASDAFEKWRYIHEYEGTHSVSEQFLLLLWHATDRLAKSRIQPDGLIAGFFRQEANP